MRTLLPMRDCIYLMEESFREFCPERATVPHRTSMSAGVHDETMLLMPGIRGNDGAG